MICIKSGPDAEAPGPQLMRPHVRLHNTTLAIQRETHAVIEHNSSRSDRLRSALQQRVARAIARTNKTKTIRIGPIRKDTRAWCEEVLSDLDVRYACARTARMLDQLEGQPVSGERLMRDLRVLRMVVGDRDE